MDAQAGANTPGWLHQPATRLEQASTDVLEKKMTDQDRIEQAEKVLAEARDELEIAENNVTQREHELAQLTGGLDLPTEPGWYLNKNDQICRLTDDGTWDDGWGNSGYGYGHTEYAGPLRKLSLA